ncbi:MAG: pyruvate kinase [Candidatus Parcubacteria bacterium]|nr:pyruvate kinase [Candidatus Parcubacteria bacterium]
MINVKTQIVATIGPASTDRETLKAMIEQGLDIVRMNFAWGDIETRIGQIKLIKELRIELDKKVSILIDLPGPRIQEDGSHTYDDTIVSAVTEQDEEFIKFATEQEVDYLSVSFVGKKEDVEKCREIVAKFSGEQKIIAKIERALALEHLEDIILSADAVMIARGDLGDEIPFEQVPFAQKQIVENCQKNNKPVIVATQMLFSMKENNKPTRAEVTDVYNAVMQGASAVMLSEETAIGKYPVETVATMKKIILEAEKHLDNTIKLNLL